MPPLTQKQMEMYLATGGVRCPYCESKNIEAEGFEGEASSELVHCGDCGERWKDIYSLVGVEAIE